MSSTYKDYNKRVTVTIDGKEVPRERCILPLLENYVADHPEIELASDRAYKRMPDGSLRRIKPKDMPKKKRRIIVED